MNGTGGKTDHKYVTMQDLMPIVVGLLRGLLSMPAGAIFGMLIGLQMGSRSAGDLAWGALIGACGAFVTRATEAGLLDTALSGSRVAGGTTTEAHVNPMGPPLTEPGGAVVVTAVE